MLPPPPSPTLFPYTTLFRSPVTAHLAPSTSPISYDDGQRATELLAQIGRVFDQRIVGQQGLRSEEHTSELQSRGHLVCRLLLEKKKKTNIQTYYLLIVTVPI